MAGNHPSELSPRQRMINMMYLVLTALLALNVSKEVLDSFFEVNKGVVRTTNNFSDKNNETYVEFERTTYTLINASFLLGRCEDVSFWTSFLGSKKYSAG